MPPPPPQSQYFHPNLQLEKVKTEEDGVQGQDTFILCTHGQWKLREKIIVLHLRMVIKIIFKNN